MSAPVLTTRQLNRALLARQHLLERSSMSPLSMIEHLVGMQAQNPLDPYTALWSRLGPFDPAGLSDAIERHAAVRMGLLRTTLHLVTARDALTIWPVARDVLRRAWRSSPFRKDLEGVDVDAVLLSAREVLVDGPTTMSALGRRLAERWPDRPPNSLSYAARFLLPIVQVPPRGLWGRKGQATWQLLGPWIGVDDAEDGPADPDDLVLRYLAAFGPASTKDIATWSWMTGVREVVDRLRPGLRTFRDERGTELLDVPDGALPGADTPAPPRFLPEYDNVALSHADRSRIIDPAAFGRITGWVGTFTTDGFVAGQWRLDRTPSTATLVLQPFKDLAGDRHDALVAEGERLLSFMAPNAGSPEVALGVAREPGPGTGTGIRAPR